MLLESLPREELEVLYERAVRTSGFMETMEDPQEDRWFRMVEPGRFDLGVGHGFYRFLPAMLLVGKGELVSRSEHYLNQQYNLSANLNESRQGVRIPRYLQVGEMPGANPYAFAIQEECPQGQRFLSRFPASNSYQRRVIADLYWNTDENFNDIVVGDQQVAITMDKNSEAFPAFFLARIGRWLNIVEPVEIKAGTKGETQRLRASYLQDQKVAKSVMARIREIGLLEESGFSMGLFFKHFGHTDLVHSPMTGTFYLPLWAMGVLPQFYGAAYWVWNVLMHSAGQSPSWAIQEVEKWREAFEARAPRELKSLFHQGFYLNLLERVLAALLADIPPKRSPFDVLKDHQHQNARKIFLAVLKRTLSLLEEERKATEALKALSDVYSRI